LESAPWPETSHVGIADPLQPDLRLRQPRQEPIRRSKLAGVDFELACLDVDDDVLSTMPSRDPWADVLLVDLLTEAGQLVSIVAPLSYLLVH
jgi:hypothetical protein